MAQVMKEKGSRIESFAAILKHRLNVLGCPYTEDLSEDSVADLVLSVGQGRLQILQWLMLQYHPKLADILEPSHNTLGWKSESKVQKILSTANVMCLCDSDDIGLIRGEGPLVKQMAFMNRLLDLVYAKADDRHESLNVSQCNNYMDTLACDESFANMMRETSVDLFPKDVRAEVDQRNNEKVIEEGVKVHYGMFHFSAPHQPDLKELMSQCQTLSQELEKQNNALQLAQSNYSVQTKDQRNEVSEMSQLLSSAIRELSQLASGFTHSFETHIGMWCEKQAPDLNNLGPTFKRVDTALQQFITVLEEVNKIRQVKGELEKNVKEKSTRTLVSAHESHEASDSFEDCLGILEEATHRLEAGFKSIYKPLLSL